jgi:hypothetical protein
MARSTGPLQTTAEDENLVLPSEDAVGGLPSAGGRFLFSQEARGSARPRHPIPT